MSGDLDLNTLTAELITVFNNGFVKNNKQFFGTNEADPDHVLTVKRYDGQLVPFFISDDRPATIGPDCAPGLYILGIFPEDFSNVGKMGESYTIVFDLVITEEHEKVVNGNTLSGQKLARYFMSHFQNGMPHLRGQFPTIKATANRGRALESTNRISESDMYGFSARYVFTIK